MAMKKVIKQKKIRDNNFISLSRKKNTGGSRIYQLILSSEVSKRIGGAFVELYVDGLNIIIKPCDEHENSFKMCPIGQRRGGRIISASSLVNTEPRLKDFLKFELIKEDNGFFYFKPFGVKNEEKS